MESSDNDDEFESELECSSSSVNKSDSSEPFRSLIDVNFGKSPLLLSLSSCVEVSGVLMFAESFWSVSETLVGFSFFTFCGKNKKKL